jgi:3-oxoacyl-[acyl-carrier-protein] synthase-3
MQASAPPASLPTTGRGAATLLISQSLTEGRLSGRSPLATLTGVQVLSVGAYAPEQIVRNEDLAEFGYDPEWILQRTGIRQRRRAAPGVATSDLAYEAAMSCLAAAGTDPRELDLILVATTTPDTVMPSTACHLQRRLGAVAPAMDLQAACAGFMYALVTGMQFIKSGCSRRVLVVGADIMSRIVSAADRKTYPLFGDGAGAVLLGPGRDDQGLLAYTLGAEGEGGDLLITRAGGSREPLTAESLAANRHCLAMDGRAVFKWAVRVIIDSIADVLYHAQVTPEEIDLLVLHQANVRIIDAAVEALGISRDKVVVNLDRYGNTSAASIPLALAEAQQEGRLHRGDRVLLCGFGAGLAWGAAVVEW